MISTNGQRRLIAGIITRVIWQAQQGWRQDENIFDFIIDTVDLKREASRKKRIKEIEAAAKAKIIEVLELGKIRTCSRFRLRIHPGLAGLLLPFKRQLSDIIKAKRPGLFNITMKGLLKEYEPEKTKKNEQQQNQT